MFPMNQRQYNGAVDNNNNNDLCRHLKRALDSQRKTALVIGSHRTFLKTAWNFLDSRRDWLEACDHLIEAVSKHEGNVGGGHARAEKYLGPCYRGNNSVGSQQ